MPTIQNGEVVQNSAVSPLGIVSSAQERVPVPIPNANTPNSAVCQSSAPAREMHSHRAGDDQHHASGDGVPDGHQRNWGK